MKKITCLLLIVSSSIAFAQESALLRYNYKKGDKYKMTLVMKQNLGLTGGMSMKMESDINVISSENNKFQLSTQTKRVKIDVAQGDQNINYDSDAKDSELDAQGMQMKSEFGEVLKAVTYQTFDKYGKIIETKTEPAIPNANTQDFIGHTKFPKEAVKVGSTWSQKLSPQGMKLDITYKVKEITSSNVIAEVTGKLTLMGIQGDLTGTASFNRASGNTDNVKLNSTIDMQGMSASMSAEVSIKKQ